MTRNLLAGRSNTFKKIYSDKKNITNLINVQPMPDKVLVEPIIPGNIIVGHENGLVSSHVSIDNILNKMKANIPPPLKSGNNIKIVDNKINAEMYDDGVLQNKISENYNVLSATITDNYKVLEANNVEVHVKIDELGCTSKQLAELQKEIKNNCDSNNKHHEERNDEIEAMIENLTAKTNDEITQYRTECEDGIDSLRNNHAILIEQIEKIMFNISDNEQRSKTSVKCLNDKNKNLDKKVDTEISKIQGIYKAEIDDLKKQLKKQGDYTEKLEQDLVNTSSMLNVAVDSKLNQMKEQQDDIINQFIKSNNILMYNMKKTMDNLHIQIHDLENGNPDGKQLQKLIKQLTTKCNKLEKLSATK